MGAKKKFKKKTPSSVNQYQYQLKIVQSETCVVCKKQCARGIRYMEKMSQPGAVGKGIPCILTRYKV